MIGKGIRPRLAAFQAGRVRYLRPPIFYNPSHPSHNQAVLKAECPPWCRRWPVADGQRDYDMRFDLLDYEATVGHLSVYYDAGGMFDIEINAGRYLAGDWGLTANWDMVIV